MTTKDLADHYFSRPQSPAQPRSSRSANVSAGHHWRRAQVIPFDKSCYLLPPGHPVISIGHLIEWSWVNHLEFKNLVCPPFGLKPEESFQMRDETSSRENKKRSSHHFFKLQRRLWPGWLRTDILQPASTWTPLFMLLTLVSETCSVLCFGSWFCSPHITCGRVQMSPNKSTCQT